MACGRSSLETPAGAEPRFHAEPARRRAPRCREARTRRPRAKARSTHGLAAGEALEQARGSVADEQQTTAADAVRLAARLLEPGAIRARRCSALCRHASRAARTRTTAAGRSTAGSTSGAISARTTAASARPTAAGTTRACATAPGAGRTRHSAAGRTGPATHWETRCSCDGTPPAADSCRCASRRRRW